MFQGDENPHDRKHEPKSGDIAAADVCGSPSTNSAPSSTFEAAAVLRDRHRAEDTPGAESGLGPCEAVASSCGDGKGRVLEGTRPLRLQCGDCAEVLHELSNVITAVLMHSHVLQWKLPPYSHLKRLVRDIERNAQRGNTLLKRLMRRLGGAELSPESEPAPVPSGAVNAGAGAKSQPHKRM